MSPHRTRLYERICVYISLLEVAYDKQVLAYNACDRTDCQALEDLLSAFKIFVAISLLHARVRRKRCNRLATRVIHLQRND